VSLFEERAARNEALFREVNEQVRALASRGPDTAATATFICECSDADCTERLTLEVSVYEAVRGRPRRFLVRPGHEGPFEEVVDRGDGYVVVEKQGTAGRIASETDPRS
jgi:hypothetical protein